MIPDSTTARRWFLWLLAVTTLVRLALAAGLPITGDEAYFVLWGRHPALGYYDHPPMVGWWLAAMLQVSDALWWLRLPAILVTVLVGAGLVWLLREIDARLAWLTGALFLASPLPLLHFVITTDTPVVLFGFLSAACFWRGVVRERLPWFLLAGLFLGLGLLSKYFAGLLALAYVAWWFIDRRKGWLLLGLLLTGLVSAALFALNLWWNWQHCWDNFLFNFLNRNSGSVPW
ncbi:MAG TPA: glycosyl transferase family 39, partial [Chromatiales bacterium]|nr:glycosyl transferase family 39 [Chromatiales bacterium]